MFACFFCAAKENGCLPTTHHKLRPARPHLSEEEERYDRASYSRAYSSSPSTSDYEEDHPERRRYLSEDGRDHVELRHWPGSDPPHRSCVGQGSRSSVSQNSSHLGQGSRSSVSQSSSSGRFQGGWGNVVQLIKNDLSEQGYLSCSSDDELFEPVYRLERILSHRQQTPDQFSERENRLSRHSSVREASGRKWQGSGIGRTQSFRCSTHSDSRGVQSQSKPVRRYSSSCSDSRPGDSQRHVHFQDDSRHHSSYSDNLRAVEGNCGGTRGREVRSYTVKSYPVRGERAHDQLTAVNGGKYQTQPQGYQQSNPDRIQNMYPGDAHISRRSIVEYNRRNGRNGFPQANGVRHFENSLSQESRVMIEEEEAKETGRGSCRVRGAHRQRAQSLREERKWEARESRRNFRERQIQQVNEEESSTTEEEEVERERERRREERRARRLPQRSLSLACSGHSSRAEPVLRRNGASLDLGELEQVLLDEELARRLQAEEEKMLRGAPQSAPTFQRPYPEGDFRVAQVAQDEEIARFMQKQEIKAKRRSQELEGYGTGREYREMTDDGAVYDRQVQRERLDSEGLLSPTEECSPEHQPPSPIAMAAQQHQYRNIAEELDPTFHRKENMLAGQNVSGPCQIQGTPHTGSCDHVEEPAFVQPTKRQNDKPIRVKSKEKKENTKPKESCKQQ
ncbi:coiled-coil domain-containing protein 187 isoform X1 [Salminus brasiliensis]|uniref:coiled-coil domain-containing protein 187 isoform X1 n=1 Tax=Salminus brasiliensis TaxID=930266 RepID=UPI003B8333B9